MDLGALWLGEKVVSAATEGTSAPEKSVAVTLRAIFHHDVPAGRGALP
jgi:hypothetical protein